MKGVTSTVIQVGFGLFVGMLIVSLVLVRIGEPVMETYSQENANLTGQLLAFSINALSNMESGRIEQTFNGTWDIFIYEDDDGQSYVNLAHYESDRAKIYRSKTRVLGNVAKMTKELLFVKVVSLEKDPGEPVVVKKVI